MVISKAVRTATALLILAILSGCSSPPKIFYVKGDGDPLMNRDAGGKSLSVEIRLYQLKDAKEFSKMTFEGLVSGRPDTELLGASLLERSEVILIPGGSYESTEKLAEGTKFIDIAGLFRNPDKHYWHQLIDVNAMTSQQGLMNREKGFSFRVKDCYIVLDGGIASALPDQSPNVKPDCGVAPRNQQSMRSPSANSNSTNSNSQPAIRSFKDQKPGWQGKALKDINNPISADQAPTSTHPNALQNNTIRN